jgi:hypothetical protein
LADVEFPLWDLDDRLRSLDPHQRQPDAAFLIVVLLARQPVAQVCRQLEQLALQVQEQRRLQLEQVRPLQPVLRRLF